MIDREAKIGIGGLAALFLGPVERDHHQPPIDLLSPIHPRGVLLPDIATLFEADAVEFDGIGLEPQDIGKLRAAFGNAEREAMRAVGLVGRLTLAGGDNRTVAKRGDARVRAAARRVRATRLR